MRPNWPLRIVVCGLLVAALIATITGFGYGRTPVAVRLIYLGVGAVWLTVALSIIERAPGNRLGRVLLGFGGLLVFFMLGDGIIGLTAGGPPSAIVGWVINLLDGPLFALVALLFLVFPTGRPPSPRWRLLVWFDVVAAAGVIVGSAFKPGPFAYYPGIDNPFAIPDFPLTAVWEPAYLLLIASVALSALSLIGRWRGGGLFERAQLKWVAAAASLVAMAMGGYAVLIGPGKFNDIADLTVGFAFGFFPVAIAIAILRCRLFEIDRLVSRTIAYVLMSAVLVGTYAGVIVLLQDPLGSVTGGDTIPVAISTLLVAALFSPVRRRVQGLVDRRFDRARFDAERTSAAFAERLREEVDIESVTSDLRDTVRAALRPDRQGLWLRQVGP